ncbi:unnamed protein product [Closterium sp. NIES-54]
MDSAFSHSHLFPHSNPTTSGPTFAPPHASSVDKSWININAVDLVQRATGCQVAAINDADAAGFAEMRFGAGRPLQREGTVLMTTFGTGIGTALFVGGHLVPNLEMGHIEVNGEIAEKVASGAVKEKLEMSWKKWAGRVNEYLARMEHYLQPDLIVSTKFCIVYRLYRIGVL